MYLPLQCCYSHKVNFVLFPLWFPQISAAELLGHLLSATGDQLKHHREVLCISFYMDKSMLHTKSNRNHLSRVQVH